MNADHEEEVETDQEVEAMIENIAEDIRNFDVIIFRRSRSRSRGRRHRERSRSRDDSRSKDLREGRCFHCSKRGHMKRDCPDLRRGGSSRSRSPSYKKRDSRRNARKYSESSSVSRGRRSPDTPRRSVSGSRGRRSYGRNPE